MDELRAGTVSSVLYRAQTKGLARVVGTSRVCGEQQSSHSNQSLTLYGKLWKRVENGRRYKEERKGRKGNRVCRKDEKSIGGGRDSTKEGIRGYKEVDRQGEEGKWRLEERRQSFIKYQGFGIQEKASKEASREIYRAIQDRGGSID